MTDPADRWALVAEQLAHTDPSCARLAWATLTPWEFATHLGPPCTCTGPPSPLYPTWTRDGDGPTVWHHRGCAVHHWLARVDQPPAAPRPACTCHQETPTMPPSTPRPADQPTGALPSPHDLEALLRRLAHGMDVPPALLGLDLDLLHTREVWTAVPLRQRIAAHIGQAGWNLGHGYALAVDWLDRRAPTVANRITDAGDRLAARVAGRR